MPTGGARTGRPGAAYANRSDLNGSDAQYGDGVNQAAVVAATPGSPSRPDTGGGIAIPPGAMGPLDAPSDRPTEPVTAGLPLGAGANTLSQPVPTRGASEDLFELRALYRVYPNEDLARLIADAENRL